jgi:hypothetical protein
MNFKNFLLLIIFIILHSCTTNPSIHKDVKKNIYKKSFINKGFAIVYSEDLFKTKIVNKKLNNRSLTIFQKNLKKGTTVRVKNLINEKYIVAEVEANSHYPTFNNSVLTKRIADQIDLDLNNPYVEIYEILENSLFIANKVKTFEEEKKVANKAPVDSISINDLNNKTKKDKKIKKKNFNYIVKIADFYYKDTAKSLIKRIKQETLLQNIRIEAITNTKFRVFLGPFDNINSLKKAFNDISILNFENIEIITNEKI